MQPSSRPSVTQLVIILGVLSAVGPLSVDMYLPALPTIAREFGVEVAPVQRTLSLFFIGLALGQALYGPIADRVGRKAPLLFGCGLYTLASAACALAPSLEVLVIARLGQALGGCAGMVITRSVVRDRFDERESARAYSFLMLVMGVAPITAPLIGGQLLGALGWRAIFWGLAAFGLICVVLVSVGLPESLPAARRARSGLGAVLRGYGRLLADRHFLGFALAGGFISAGMFAYISGSPFVFIELYGVPATQYGWIFGLNALGFILASQLNRWLLGRYRGAQILLATALVAAASGLLLVGVALAGLGGLVGLLPPLFICVASGGLIGPNSSAAAMAPHGEAAGSASALLGALQFGVGTVASLAVEALHNGSALPMAATVACCCAAGLICLVSLALRPGGGVVSPANT
jgi:DHA1 family bicyclomycin/chloramphenicol resistance-like MFS transporter